MDDADKPHGNVLGRLTGSVTGAVAGVVTGPLVDSIDPDELLERVDVNALLDRVDVNRLLDRVDPNPLLDRVDVDRLLDRVDVDRLLARADVAGLVERSGVPDIVAQSTGRFAGSALDTARRQLLILDLALERVVDTLLRRHRSTWAEAPIRLRPDGPRLSDSGQLDVSGRYAGPLTRLVALVADVWIFVASLTLLLAGLRFLNRELFPSIEVSAPTWAWALLGGFAGLLYVFMCLESVGRTPGKALVGVRVVTADGATLGEGRALLRTLAFPVSVVLAGAGLLLSVVHPRQLGLHDVLARTAVVHDWSPRRVELPEAIARKLVR